MKVHLIKRQSIEGYMLQNARSRTSFRLWLSLLKQADWREPGHIMETFGAADLLGNGSDRVVFDIGGNNYRMICKYHLGVTKIHLYVKWIGTHAQYTELCKNNDQYSISIY
jgi:mRNA interferase HigB